ncbi:hypothetical protein I6E81_10595 [Salinibacterium sp. NG22]|uniref:hypothetical protein n=1 Tax=Salinibacterium sp. NG22 TaxID=2792040 RepID=UPI0018CF4377|nr:hypothetical protein [Salinibacterium sp. NG22]MBH0110616.1 hypothetical protein [Salinibacterium sp. NG22]
MASPPSRGRVTVIMMAVIAAMGFYFLLFALVSGLAEYSGDWNGPLIVETRKLGRWEFAQAWHFFVPVGSVLLLSVIGMFGSLIHIVMNPRDGRSAAPSRGE